MRLAWYCAILAVVIAPAALLIASVIHHGVGPETISSAAIGGGVCWLAAALGLSATFLGNRYHAPIQGVLAGMLFRMGLPLAALAALPKLGGSFAAPGVATTILGVYLVALIVETLLALRLVPSRTSPSGAKATVI